MRFTWTSRLNDTRGAERWDASESDRSTADAFFMSTTERWATTVVAVWRVQCANVRKNERIFSNIYQNIKLIVLIELTFDYVIGLQFCS